MIDIKAGNQLYILQLKLKTQDYNVTNYTNNHTLCFVQES